MQPLDLSIAEWRRSLQSAPSFTPETLDELESHLRDTVQRLVASGEEESAAFAEAVAQLGTPAVVAAEFAKLQDWSWLPTKVIAGLGLVLAAGLLCPVLDGVLRKHLDPLVALHVACLSLGYFSTLLLGVWGMCLVCRRCVAPFSDRQLRSLMRVSRSCLRLAAVLVAAGVVLGMLWARRSWGHFWMWDPREIGTVMLLVWLAASLLGHRSRLIPPHALLLSSLMGSTIVITLACFMPQFHPGRVSYGHASTLQPMALILIHLFFALLGLAPGGWLRLRRA